MSRVIWAWVFGAVFFQLSAGAVYASFARQLGASESVFGFLAGVYPLMGFLQIPAARLLEGGVSPRKMMLWSGLICRILWVFGASLPLLFYAFPDSIQREWLLPAFISCVVLSSIGQSFTSPAFFAWMSELIPGRVGPSFWARRQQIGTIAGIFAVLIGGFLADQAGVLKEATNGEFTPLLLYSLILIVAAVCGTLDIALFLGVREPPTLSQPKLERAPFWESLREPLREKTVRNYLAFTMAAMLGFATTGPLLWLFCLEFLEWEKTLTGFVLTVCPLAGMAISARFWGSIAKTHGTKAMLRFTSILLVLIPVFWLFALPESKFGLALSIFFSGILACSYEIANFNFVTRACPHLPRPTLTALFAICAGTTFALASTLAGVLTQYAAHLRFEIAGMQFANFHLVFAFSLVPRLINAFILAPRLEEPEGVGVRQTVNEVGENLARAFATKFTRFFEAREE